MIYFQTIMYLNVFFDQRISALSIFCQAYLEKLNLIHIDLLKYIPEISTALNDLINISKLQYNIINRKKDQQTYYTKLVEYTKISVLFITNIFNKKLEIFNISLIIFPKYNSIFKNFK